MEIYHDSRSIKYRDPFGAAPVGSDIMLSLVVRDTIPENVSVVLRRDDSSVPQFIGMREVAGANGMRKYAATIKAPETGCLLW